MKFVLAPEAVKQLESQIGYLRDVGAEHAAEWLRVRVTAFLSEHLVRYPRTGRPLGDRDLWETWIPRTRLVVWYRIEDEQILVVTVWHTSQDRSVAKT
jgi:plasmid stabilization system protein ParE